MSSGFISESALEERRKVRQEEWEKVRNPDQPLEAPEEEYDHRSLFDRLQEQKQKRDQEYEEAHKLKNMIKGLDDDEVEFLDLVDRTKMEEEKRKWQEEAKEMQDFRNAVATLQEQSVQDRIKTEIKKPELKKASVSNDVSIGSKKSSQLKLLAGAVKKRSSEPADSSPKKKTKLENSDIDEATKNGSLPTSSGEDGVTRIDEVKTSPDKRKRQTEENKDVDHSAEPQSVPTGLRCIGILPGITSYSDSSDSEESSDTEEDMRMMFGYDLCGRKVVRIRKTKSAS